MKAIKCRNHAKGNLYWCKHCKKEVRRNSVKGWIDTTCSLTGGRVRLMLRQMATEVPLPPLEEFDGEEEQIVESVRIRFYQRDLDEWKRSKRRKKPKMILTNRHLDGVVFENMDLRNYDFSNSELHNCMFKNCQLHSANFTGTKFRYTTFDRSRLDYGVFNYCSGMFLKFYMCDAAHTKFKYCKFDWLEFEFTRISWADLQFTKVIQLEINHSDTRGVKGLKRIALAWSLHGECGREVSVTKLGSGGTTQFHCGCFHGSRKELEYLIRNEDPPLAPSRTEVLKTLLSLWKHDRKTINPTITV